MRYAETSQYQGYIDQKVFDGELEIPDYKADVCTAFAQGNMGRAIMLANSEHFNEVREEAVQLLKYIHEMELSRL